MDKVATIKLAGVGLMLFLAAGITISTWGSGSQSDPMEYYYDLSERQVFQAPRSSIAPIVGVNGDEIDGVRAIQIRDADAPHDESSFRIAYLQKHTPELQEAIRAGRSGESEQDHSRAWVKRNTLISTIDELKWYPSDSTRGMAILDAWYVKDANGKYPVICTPDSD